MQRDNFLNTPMTASYNDPVVAVDELGREIRMTRTGQRYLATDFTPSRPQATSGRGLGYNILDNIIGYDDGVDTPGERAGAAIGALASDPIGAARGAAEGVGGLIQRLVGGTGTMGDVIDATGLLNVGSLAATAPSGALRAGASRSSRFDVSRRDASNIFGEGSERVRYTDPQSGGTIEVVVRPDGSASVLELEVPEASRGQGIGQELQRQVLQDFPVMSGQVSSKAAATTAYRLGRRPQGMPNATLEDVFGMIDENSSVNLVSPAAQIVETPAQRVAGLLSSGRADEVTDEMMAAVDPQEMARLYASGATGMDLPMDEVSRMARAREMGFTDTAYHSTGVDFQAFVPSEFRGASFFGSTPGGASRGASASANEGVGSGSTITMPVRVNTRNVEGLGAYGRRDMNEFAASLPDRLYTEAEVDALMASEAAPIYGDWSYFFNDLTDYEALRNFRDSNPSAEIPAGIIKFRPKQPLSYTPELRSDISGRQFAHYSEGMSERPISEHTREIGNTGFTMMDESGLALAITDPTQIRSRFARFDPRLSHLSNLNAANASPLLGGAVLAAPQEQPDPLRNLRGLLAR